MVHVCLGMIVKNESKIIGRCLDHAKSFIDSICICDTGSDDRTPRIIRTWGKKNNIPTTVHTVKRNLDSIIQDGLKVLEGNSEKNITRRFSSLMEELHDWPLAEEIVTTFRYPQKAFQDKENTIAKLKKYLELYQGARHPDDTSFINFSHNRTQSFTMARKTYPEADYILLIDADMIFQPKDYDKNSLTEGCYRLYQVSNNLKYVNTRIISTKHDWRCVGVTHEYWEASGASTQTIPAEELAILDVGDGGCKSDKFVRDVRLLTQGIKDESDNGLRGRYKFYLAQSYKDLGKFEEAIEWYRQRIHHGGWDEEIWCSHYMIATCYLNMAKKTNSEIKLCVEKKQKTAVKDLILDQENYEGEALCWANRAITYRRFRAEPMVMMASYYRECGRNELAYMYANMALMPYCKRGLQDILFVEHPAYTYKGLFEICITAYYIELYEEGLEACHKLLELPQTPENIKDRVRKNITFYQDKIKT